MDLIHTYYFQEWFQNICFSGEKLFYVTDNRLVLSGRLKQDSSFDFADKYSTGNT